LIVFRHVLYTLLNPEALLTRCFGKCLNTPVIPES
jgi:hypothetical protein